MQSCRSDHAAPLELLTEKVQNKSNMLEVGDGL